MRIAGFQKLSLVDYDGLTACTVFTAGCNLRCPYCHNAPLITATNDLVEHKQLFDYLAQRKGILDGVCVTGGEPTLQVDLIDFISKVKGTGYKVKLDTNGTCSTMLDSILKQNLVDYVAMDIKTSLSRYNEFGATKQDVANIAQCVELLKKSSVEYEFRTTLVQEYVNKEDIVLIGEWLRSARKYVLQKYIDNSNCLQHGFTAVSIQKAKQYATTLQQTIKEVALRNY